MKNKKKVLIVIDASYMIYYSLFGAVSKWKKTSINGKCIKDPEETDQTNLPDLTIYPDFCKILQSYIMKRFDTIRWIIRSNIQEQVDDAESIDIILATDGPLTNNWRKKKYPHYKAQRKVCLKQFNTYKVINYVLNTIFKKLDVENSQNLNIIKHNNAEGDDIIATALMKLDGYSTKFLIASDHDFLQIPNVKQFDLMGREKTIYPKIKDHNITPEKYIVVKSIVGDGADNIPSVFSGIKEVRAIKLVNNPNELKEKFKENNNSIKQYIINKELIDFKNIPEDLSNEILEQINEKLSNKNKNMEEDLDLSDLMKL